MYISEQEARRWRLLAPGPVGMERVFAPPLRLIPKSVEPLQQTPAEELDIEPSPDTLIEAFQKWRQVKDEVTAIEKEIALRLMEYRYISIKKLAEELGISRPTLYAWQSEAVEAKVREATSVYGDGECGGD